MKRARLRTWSFIRACQTKWMQPLNGPSANGHSSLRFAAESPSASTFWLECLPILRLSLLARSLRPSHRQHDRERQTGCGSVGQRQKKGEKRLKGPNTSSESNIVRSRKSSSPFSPRLPCSLPDCPCVTVKSLFFSYLVSRIHLSPFVQTAGYMLLLVTLIVKSDLLEIVFEAKSLHRQPGPRRDSVCPQILCNPLCGSGPVSLSRLPS